jgi:hypothetical protein
MPITISNRSVGSGNGSLMVPLVANNPAFKVEILPVDGRLEQKPFAKDGTKQIESIKVGNTVRGQIVSTKTDVRGRVLQINQANGQIVSYKVLTDDGEEVLLDPTTTVKYIDHGQEDSVVGGNPNVSSPYNESRRILNYSEWLAENSSK